MAKDLSWFKFKIVHWLMGKIQKQSDHLKITFLDLCCKYWSDGCVLSVEDAKDLCGEDEYNILFEEKIVKEKKGNIYIKFLHDQIIDIEELAEKRRLAALKRYENKDN